MIPFLALVAALGLRQGGPDQANGYEDYLAAAKIVEQADVGALMSSNPNQYLFDLQSKEQLKETGEWSDEDEARLQRDKAVFENGFIALDKMILGKCGVALDRVRIGNQKRSWNPRPQVDTADLFPQLAQFKTIAKLFAMDAYVKFGSGDSASGTRSLLDGLAFAGRIGGDSLIAELVSVASVSIELAGFERHLGSLSLKDCQAIVAAVDAALAEKPSFATAVRKERDLIGAQLDEALSNVDPAGGGDLNDPNLEALSKFLKPMSPAARAEFRSMVLSEADRSFKEVLDRLAQDESKWLAPSKAEEPAPPVPTSPRGYARMLLDILMPVFDQAASSVLMRRAQLRLLGLHARVIAFRWTHGHLPETLAAAVPKELLYDPFANKPFHYELTDTGYALYSEGDKEHGKVELRWRRSPGAAEGDDKIPPPRRS